MPTRDPMLARALPVFAGAEAGHYTLPADLLRYPAAITRLRAQLTRAHEAQMAANPAATRSKLAAWLPGAARDGEIPDGWIDDLLRAQDEQVRRGAEALVLDEAVDRARRDLFAAVGDYADEVITDHLRPALAAVIATVRKVSAGREATLPFDQPRLLAKAPKPIRDAFVVVEQQVERYSAIREAQRALRAVTGDCDDDAWSLFHELKGGVPAVWPNHAWRVPQNTPPWPENQNARLVWLARPDLQVWVPTGTECQRAYDVWVRTAKTGPIPGALRVP